MRNRRTWWGVAAGTVAIAAMFVAFDVVHHTETVARQNETRAQLISDQYESFYAIYAAQLLDSGSRSTTNAQLEPAAVARAHQIQIGDPNFTFLGYSGSAKLLERDESLGLTWVSIEVDVTYPEAFGGHGALATCYAVSIPASPKTSAPVTSFLPSCPRRGEGPLPYPSATS